MADFAHAAQELQSFEIARAAAHQRAVNLHQLHGKRLQVIERGEARTKIVERKPYAVGDHARHEIAHGGGASQRRCLGDFNAQMVDDRARGAQCILEPGDAFLVAERVRAHVDRHIVDPRENRRLRQRLEGAKQHEAVDAGSQSMLLGNRQELLRAAQFIGAIAHPKQNLQRRPAACAAADRHDGLAPQLESFVLERVLDVRYGAHAGERAQDRRVVERAQVHRISAPVVSGAACNLSSDPNVAWRALPRYYGYDTYAQRDPGRFGAFILGGAMDTGHEPFRDGAGLRLVSIKKYDCYLVLRDAEQMVRFAYESLRQITENPLRPHGGR